MHTFIKDHDFNNKTDYPGHRIMYLLTFLIIILLFICQNSFTCTQLLRHAATEHPSTTLTDQQKRNMLVGMVETQPPLSQQQPAVTSEDPNLLTNEVQVSKTPLQQKNGNNLQKHQVLPIQSTVRGRSNVLPLSDTQNQTKPVSLNNKVCFIRETSLNIII